MNHYQFLNLLMLQLIVQKLKHYHSFGGGRRNDKNERNGRGRNDFRAQKSERTFESAAAGEHPADTV